jgi:hypothetical protein
MGEYQTIVQDLGAILRGSGMLEISPVAATPSWLDVGAIQGLKFSEELEVNAEENDNTDSEDRVTKQTGTVACTLMEPLSDAVRQIMRGGLDTRSSVAGTPVSGATHVLESGSWDVQKPYILPGQNDDKSKQTIVSVMGSVDGALAAGEDYEQVQMPNGDWGILFMTIDEAAALTTIEQDITVTYDYTPSASVTWKSGNKSVLPKFMARITTKNDDNTFIVEFYYGNIKKGLGLEYSKDDDNDRRVGMPIEIMFKTLPAGQGSPSNEGMVHGSVQISGF